MEGRLYATGKAIGQMEDIAKVPINDVEISAFTGGDDRDFYGGDTYDFSGLSGKRFQNDRYSNTIGDVLSGLKDKATDFLTKNNISIPGINQPLTTDTTTGADTKTSTDKSSDNSNTTDTTIFGMHPLTAAFVGIGTVALVWTAFALAKKLKKSQ